MGRRPRYLQVRRIASGPVKDAFTSQNLRAAYGGRVAFVEKPLSAASEIPAETVIDKQAEEA